jgi:hypothetical protein
LLKNKLSEDEIDNSNPLSLAENLEVERELEKIEVKKEVLKIKAQNSISNFKSSINSALSTMRSNMAKMAACEKVQGADQVSCCIYVGGSTENCRTFEYQ